MEVDLLLKFFEKSPVAFACYQAILDERHLPCDCAYIKVNAAFEKLTGLAAENIINKRFSEVFPADSGNENGGIEKWQKAFSQTLAGIDDVSLDFHLCGIGKWVRVNAFLIGEGKFACIFKDISEEHKLNFEMRIVEKESNMFQKALEDKNKLIEMIMDNVPVGIWMTGEKPHNIFMNKYVRDNFNLLPEEKEVCRMTDRSVLRQSGALHHEEMITFKDGKKHILETVKTKIEMMGGRGSAILGTGLDITDRKRAEEALRISEKRYRFLTENTSDVIWVVNVRENRYAYVSPSVFQLRGFTPEEAMAQSIAESVTPESLLKLHKVLPRRLKAFLKNPVQSNTTIIEVQQPCKNGEIVWVEMSVKLQYNEEGAIEAIGVSRNVGERKKTESEVLFLSYHDQLTGLYNRRFYEEEMKRINNLRNHPITLVMADLDDLKRANDSYGHAAGDELLKAFADVLRKECRSDDIIARIGGDEFIILLPKSDYSEGEKIVRRVNAEIAKRHTDQVPLSVSFGWQTKHKKEEGFDLIFKQAEDMMYNHKNVRVSGIR